MVKWKIVLIIIAIVVLSLGISFSVDAIVAYTHKVVYVPVKQLSINFGTDDLYLGNCAMDGVLKTDSFNIAELLGYGEGVIVESLNDDIAEIADNEISVKSFGSLSVKIIDGASSIEKTFITVEGVNVTRAFDLLALSNDYAVISDNIVLQNDIVLFDLDNNREKFDDYNVNAFRIKSNFYGNGFSVFSEGFNRYWYQPTIIFCGNDCILKDSRFIGKNISEGEEFDLNDLTQYGSLVAFGYKSMYNSKTTVKNCIFENSNRNAYIEGAEVEFSGCIFRNASDSNVSIKTVEKRPSNVSFENCVFAHQVVAGISNWCSDSVPDESQCTINIKENVLFYCWKNSETANIVPASESNAKTFNGYLQDKLKTQEAKASMYKLNDNYYVNSALIVICTGTGNKNTPVVNGLDAVGIKKYDIPLDWYISMFLTTSDLYGYCNGDVLSPLEGIEDNPNISVK